MASPNTIILEFLAALPPRTRENLQSLGLMYSQPDLVLEPDTDWEGEAQRSINPTSSGSLPRQGAAIIWSGMLDYILQRDIPAPSSADMHRMADEYRDEHGHESTHIRALADNQDTINADFEAAAKKWQSLRDGPLSISALQRAHFGRDKQ